MTRKAIKKIEGTIHKTKLEHKKKTIKQLTKMGQRESAISVKGSIAGYVQALQCCGVITERERQCLLNYYITTD